MRTFLKSKIYGAIVTETSLNYDGSITIDKSLMKAVDILPYEKVEVMNMNNGARFETYAIEGEKGEICLNGACARQGVAGDKVIILSYEIGENNMVSRLKASNPENHFYPQDPRHKEWDRLLTSVYDHYSAPHCVYVNEADNSILVEVDTKSPAFL